MRVRVKRSMVNFGPLWSLWSLRDDLQCHSSLRTAVPATERGREDSRKPNADVNNDHYDSDTCMST